MRARLALLSLLLGCSRENVTATDARAIVRTVSALPEFAQRFQGAQPSTLHPRFGASSLVPLHVETADPSFHLDSVSPLDRDARIIQLIDRTGSYAAERMRVDFVASASHELKTPLASLLGYIETLADPEAGGEATVRDRFLTVMAGEAARMRALVDDLLSLSRIEAEKYVAPTATIDLAALAAAVVGELRAGSPTRGAGSG